MNAVNGQAGEFRAWEGFPAFPHIAGGSSDDQACHHSAGPSAAVVEAFAVVEIAVLVAVLVNVDYFALLSSSASVLVKKLSMR